ncbi:hypothetical protein [Pedobacter sp. NJ-S-72]
MILAILGDSIEQVFIHDINPIDITKISGAAYKNVIIARSWEECYIHADIFMTCTVSAAPYISIAPKKGSLQLNVSLRDYTAEMKDYMDTIVVDNWEEVLPSEYGY